MIGASAITTGGYENGFLFADKCNCTAIQMYITQSRTWTVAPLKEGQARLYNKMWKNSNVKSVVAHGSLLMNIASSDDVIKTKSVNRLLTEVNRCIDLGIKNIVIHPGSNKNKELGIKNIIDNLIYVAENTNDVHILLENVAGQGNAIGGNFEEIALILDSIGYSDRFGICFDTCHAFAYGYDIRGLSGYLKVFDELDKTIGVEKIGAFHVNDSKVDIGVKVDRHADVIGNGFIGIETFSALLRDERFFDIPMIAEVPNGEFMTIPNVEILNNLRYST